MRSPGTGRLPALRALACAALAYAALGLALATWLLWPRLGAVHLRGDWGGQLGGAAQFFVGDARNDVPGSVLPSPLHESRVAVWVPHSERCDGIFAVRTSQTEPDGPVALVVREATVDYRHVSLAELRAKGSSPNARRVLILMTNLPQKENDMFTYIKETRQKGELSPAASLVYPNGSAVTGGASRGWTSSVSFDYLLEDKSCEQNCKVYSRCRVREWKAVVTVRNFGSPLPGFLLPPNSVDLWLERLKRDGVRLRLSFHVALRTDEAKIERLEVEVGLSCIAGLVPETQMPPMPYMPPRKESCAEARGAVQISGGALFGRARHDPASWRLLAHFAARHLYGTTSYDTVAIALLPEYSVREIWSLCKTDAANSTCVPALHKSNREYVETVRNGVEDELEKLQVPRQDWARIALFMFCRLGTDFEGSEAGLPCDASHHAGQKVLGHAAYAMFAPFHRWASNFDLDEFLYDEAAPVRPRTEALEESRSAYLRFEQLRTATRRSVFYTKWLDFRVNDVDTVDFTRRIMHSQPFNFTGHDRQPLKVSDCYDGGGKVAVSCERSTSFMIHFGYALKNLSDFGSGNCVHRHERTVSEAALYTYHVRKPPRQGQCLYDPRVQANELCTRDPRTERTCAPGGSSSGVKR